MVVSASLVVRSSCRVAHTLEAREIICPGRASVIPVREKHRSSVLPLGSLRTGIRLVRPRVDPSGICLNQASADLRVGIRLIRLCADLGESAL